MKFRNDTDEKACGAEIDLGKHVVACLRTAGHEGKHIAMAYEAAKADKICFGCRMPADEMHREGCDARLVECAFCLERFERAANVVSYHMGLGCSATILNGKLFGGYGSQFDFDLYKIDGEISGFENADPVCDGCIMGMLSQGIISKLVPVDM